MATLTTTLAAVFTPAVGDFNVQASGGLAYLQRRQTSGAAWVTVGSFQNEGCIVSNPIAAADFRFMSHSSTTVVQADQ